MLNLPNAKSVAQALATQLAAHGEAPAEPLQRWLDVLERSDIRGEISRLKNTPLMIVQGGRDMLVPVACGDWLARALPHAEYFKLDGAAHAPFISHGAIFVERLTQFLGEEFDGTDMQPPPLSQPLSRRGREEQTGSR
jgi:pimeloyl-[acyl-carrier protein] methyl ester esterase